MKRSNHIIIILMFILDSDIGSTLRIQPESASSRSRRPKAFFPEFEQTTLEYYIKRSYSFPTCVLFLAEEEEGQDAITFESKLSSHLKNSSNQDLFSHWHFGSYRSESLKNHRYISSPERLPTLRCYFGTWSHEDYYPGKGRKTHFQKWLEDLAQVHALRIPEADSATLDDFILSLDLTTDIHVIVAFPGSGKSDHFRVEQILYKVKEQFQQVQLLMVHSWSPSESVLRTRFSVNSFPTILIFEPKNYRRGCKTSTLRLEGDQMTQENLEEYLVLTLSTAIKLSKKTFEREVMDSQLAYFPILVVFYWPQRGKVTPHVSAVQRSLDTFTVLGVTLRFGLMDLSTNKEVLLKWVDASHARSHPFSVLFWWTKKGKEEPTFHQKLLPSPRIPTPWQVFSFIEENGAPFVDKRGHPVEYSPWQSNESVGRHGFTNMKDGVCYATSNVTFEELTDIPIAKSTVVPRPKKRVKSVGPGKDESSGYGGTDQSRWKAAAVKGSHPDLPELKRIGNLSLLTESTWSEVVERSHAPGHPLEGGQAWRGEVTGVALVIFVQAGCGSCARKLATVFQKVSQAVDFIDGGSAYLLNCTTDPAICRDQGIVGYPTLIAYRGLGWLGSEPCLSDTIHARYTRLTYHGALLEKEIMEWFSEISQPAVNRNFVEDLEDELKLDQTVRLVATLYPKAVATRLLRTVTAGHWFPYQCYRLVCERLYGLATCFTTITSNLPASTHSSAAHDMIVTQVEMFRADGASTQLAVQGTPLSLTLHDRASPQLHTFHRPHRYDIPAGLKCEDNPVFCTELLVKFVRDHRHLPVTPLTLSTFHTIYSGDSSESKADLPLLLALAHHENISGNNTPFMKVLNGVACELYNQMMVMTVDIDLFPGWAAQFVPYNYRRHIIDNSDLITEEQVPSLYVYPRLCIVHWLDHQHAAFYPPLPPPHSFHLVPRHQQVEMGKDEIVQFAKDYLQRPDLLLKRTEHF